MAEVIKVVDEKGRKALLVRIGRGRCRVHVIASEIPWVEPDVDYPDVFDSKEELEDYLDDFYKMNCELYSQNVGMKQLRMVIEDILVREFGWDRVRARDVARKITEFSRRHQEW